MKNKKNTNKSNWLDIAMKMNKGKSISEPWELPEGFPKMRK